jgi:hypothetical protein
MSAADEIIADLPMDQLAAELGTDAATAEQAVRSTLPTLFGGLQTNVTADDRGAVSLAEALTQHSDPQFFSGGIDLASVNTADGQAIVNHMFANSPDSAELLQARSGGLDGGMLSKLLPILAPIVMSYIARKLGMGGAAQQQSSNDGGLGGLGDLLGPILGGMFGGGGGGASGGGSTGSGGGGFGDILGQILAGQSPQAEQAPVQQHDDGQWQQPQFNPPGASDGAVRMPTAEEDPAAT